MKRIASLLLVTAMLAVMVLSLASCSVYGTIESNFVNAGYEVVEPESTEGKIATALTGSFASEDGEVSVTTHIFKKDGAFVNSYAFVIEFGADAEAQKTLEEYMSKKDWENYMKVDEELSLVRGNCVLIPWSLDKDVHKEMVELFNK